MMHSADTELARVQGVVVRTTPTTSRVRLVASELVVTVPTALLRPELAKYGQPVDCVIRRRPDGHRYQAFERRTAGPKQTANQRLDFFMWATLIDADEHGRHKPDGTLLYSSDIEDTYLSLRQGTDDDPIDLVAVKATAEKLGQTYDYILHALDTDFGY